MISEAGTADGIVLASLSPLAQGMEDQAMRRTYLALIAVTFGLLTLACSGGGSNLVGPGAVTGSSQMSSGSTTLGTAGVARVQAHNGYGQDPGPID